MEEIRNAIARCQLHWKFDDFTVGDGNCFPRAVVQQCRRVEINTNLTENRKTKTKHYMNVRAAVCKFMTSSQHPSMQQFKQSYIENEWPTNGISWNDYWIAMSQDKVWVHPGHSMVLESGHHGHHNNEHTSQPLHLHQW